MQLLLLMLTLAASPMPGAPASAPTASAAPFSLGIDATTVQPAASGAWLAPLQTLSASMQQSVAQWANINAGTQCLRAWPPPHSASSCIYYAGAFLCGASVVLYNPATSPLTVNLRMRLPAGKYTAELLTPTTNSNAAPQVQELHGLSLAACTTCRFPVSIPPGGICIYRLTNQTQRARASLRQVYADLHLLALHRPKPARSMREDLAGSWNLLHRFARAQSQNGMRSLHALLLDAEQIQAASMNMDMHHQHYALLAAPLENALKSYMDALAYMGAVQLGLTVQTNLVQNPAGKLLLCITLQNNGRHSVYGVQLGSKNILLNRAAVYPVLHPGQSANASFPAAVKPFAAISFMAGGGPVQLHALPWQMPAAPASSPTQTQG